MRRSLGRRPLLPDPPIVFSHPQPPFRPRGWNIEFYVVGLPRGRKINSPAAPVSSCCSVAPPDAALYDTRDASSTHRVMAHPPPAGLPCNPSELGCAECLLDPLGPSPVARPFYGPYPSDQAPVHVLRRLGLRNLPDGPPASYPRHDSMPSLDDDGDDPPCSSSCGPSLLALTRFLGPADLGRLRCVSSLSWLPGPAVPVPESAQPYRTIRWNSRQRALLPHRHPALQPL